MRLGVCLIAAAVLGGCASHRVPRADESTLQLDTMIEKVRQLSVAARPPRTNEAATFERRDVRLAAARALVTIAPTAEHHRAVAGEYVRLGILDLAYNHFAAALHLDPHDAAAYDGRARVWRDWGYPHLGLSDVYRAIFYAPQSPAPRNTLGTLLLNMKLNAQAREAFEQTLARDPGAAYALNNLCYASLMEGDNLRAIDRCRGALEVQPDLQTARNNLALAYAAHGNWAAATSEFRAAATPARASYNMGVALMATGRFGEAAGAFDQAAALDAALTDARARAKQARTLAAKFRAEGSE